ncbi:MAG: hypothetical protein ACD_49C00055G0002 [uncultured bacterium (gcode 4)]|uniref:DNA-directed RNA polymerase subunit beta' n=1 Tax=uncultured bacterium (gcode 4) TaxID=1234023 RepID=K2ADY4_9BACT|nr:MAG: hypothetical protein ACD_49C00055G0002 [uncultured bacterium (gcode 4)]
MFKDKNFENFLNDKITDFSQIGKYAWKRDIAAWKNLDNLAGIAIWISSKEQIRALSYWEVLISETINYRTQRPERGWLFCEQIFGPRKNYECACWKYKRIRYKWVICERCWVEVTTSQVRRQRAGHIELAAPVAHIWYLKSVPSRIGLLLDISVKKLEQVVYFASYIITDVFEDKKDEVLKDLEALYKSSKVDLQKKSQQTVNEAKIQLEKKQIKKKELKDLEFTISKQIDALDEEYAKLKWLLKELKESTVIWELDYRILYEKFPHVFKWGTWVEHIRVLLQRIDLKKFISDNQKELKSSPKSKQKKILQKLKLASNLFKSDQRPENFVLEALQIIPPDLRPMIQLDGWRFASSDLNDLYRRVINRNNRLRKLSELGAPDVILKNEKRMLQEAVDMLINWDVRSNRPGYTTATKKKLKSLAEILKWKQGRFRQNLLWKRVDYSGRSVIVVWPELKMNECWLPKIMALTLFKPFVIGKLIAAEMAYNVKHAEKIIDEKNKEVWDALDEVIKWKYVLLNRAPTLHRLWIQAFSPVLIEWKAIRLHPLCCTAFNADFDWDQMAVHLPLTQEAQDEASEIMVTSKNMLNPSNWEPIVAPSQDMLLGCYYLTKINEKEEIKYSFNSIDDATCAYEAKWITLHTPINVRINGEIIKTTYGRLLFNEIIPDELGFINETMLKWKVKKILASSFDLFWSEFTAFFSDRIKNVWYKYATLSGLSISKEDMKVPDNKWELMKGWEEKIKWIQKKFWNWFMTEKERYEQSVKVWSEVKNIIEKEMPQYFDSSNHIHHMIVSGARWNWGNVTQLCWMKWLVASPSGKTIELPIKANYKEWLSVLEYFINTHSGRKGKADTALKTAQSGYLTRRLVDAAQNILVREENCNTLNYEEINKKSSQSLFRESFEEKIYGKYLAKDIVSWKKVIIESGTLITKDILAIIKEENIESVFIRSVLTCESEWWVCQKCYGLDLGYNEIVKIWNPVWIIAAQSIWEPGTQLTMRTFHTGWVAKEWWDITQGLTRVDELFEARTPKYEALISTVDGTVTSVKYREKLIELKITASWLETKEYYLPEDNYKIAVKKWDKVDEKHILARSDDKKNKILNLKVWVVSKIEWNTIFVTDEEPQVIKYEIEFGKNILLKQWDKVSIWDKVIEGHINIHKLMELGGPLKTQSYIVNDIKEIYTSQWQTVNSKHIELIVRQMFSKVKITNAGDSSFFPGDIVDIIRFKKENDLIAVAWWKQAIGTRLLLGLTKISLFTDSWLSAASFQETVRVLVEASVSRKIDTLSGLKENVIIGRLIPTGKYFENNMNVWGYFWENQDDELSYEKVMIDRESREDYGSLN